MVFLAMLFQKRIHYQENYLRKIAMSGAITTNSKESVAVGKLIMDAGGSAADIAIATIFCKRITCPQSSGLGGGFLLTIYIKSTRTLAALPEVW